ncbi:MAG: hypothetical protein AB8B95_15595 [Pseudohongiellaceae bacterium]
MLQTVIKNQKLTNFSAASLSLSFLVLLIPQLSLASDLITDPLFSDDLPLEITLSAPFAEINKERDKSKEYRGTLHYSDENAATTLFDVKVSPRGNSRLRAKECRSAQLWVDFKKSQTVGTVFEGQNKLKLVVQCGSKTRGAQWLLKENLAYKVFEEFSDFHFKTRMLKVTYEDTGSGKQKSAQLAFFIEHHKNIARRHRMELEDQNAVSIAELNPQQSSAIAMFAYLIGNTDFSAIQGPVGEKCCHNIKLLVDDQGQRFPLPYDFDNTGWVSAGYALGPSPNIGIKSTRERRYRGFCLHNDELYGAVLASAEKEAAVLSIIEESEGISENNKRQLRNFADDYFKIVSQPSAARELVQNCRYPQEISSSESSS